MKATIVSCVFALASINLLSQDFTLGAMAGVQMSSFVNGNPLAGWKAAAVGNYGVGRFKFTEQLGVTTDRTRSRMPSLPARNTWQYVWADATTVVSYLPISRPDFDISLGSGVSIRRILSQTLNVDPNGVGDFANSLYEWTYFLPVRIGVDIRMPRGRKVNCALEYQFQLRELHRAPTITSSSDYKDYINELYSLGLTMAYMFSVRH